SDVPPPKNSDPNRTRSRRSELIPPSNIPVPTESTPMVASCCAPSLLHNSCDIRSDIRTPLAAWQIQPSTSLSQERYSNGPPWADFCRRVRRKSYMVDGS